MTRALAKGSLQNLSCIASLQTTAAESFVLACPVLYADCAMTFCLSSGESLYCLSPSSQLLQHIWALSTCTRMLIYQVRAVRVAEGVG